MPLSRSVVRALVIAFSSVFLLVMVEINNVNSPAGTEGTVVMILYA